MEKLKSLFRAGSIAAAGAVVASPAFAALDMTAVESAIDGAATNGESAGSLVIGAVAIMVGIGLVIAIVRKI